jgi:hypothetical protein
VRFDQPERLLTFGRDVRGMPFLNEAATDERRHLRLVLDDENPHGSICCLFSMRAG